MTRDAPAHNGFNHVILAIKLPDDVKDPSLIAVIQHPKLGRILFFDPTYDVFIPFGQIEGYLQANYGLLGNAGRRRTGRVAAAAVGNEQHPAHSQVDARLLGAP